MKFEIERALTRKQALDGLCRHWNPVHESELIPLQEALGRVTACDIYAEHTLPVCRVSAFDGFAVRSEDFENGLPDTSDWVRGREYVPADTGDDFPDGYDTVIAVEDVSFDAQGTLHFAENFSFVKGDAVRPAGSTVKEGELLVNAHTRITPELLAGLAVGGARLVPVIRKLKAAYIPTGTELIPAGTVPQRGENVEANGLLLSGMLSAWGVETICMPIVRDNPQHISDTLRQALACADLVILNGGSSRGGEDFNARLLEQGADYFSHGVKAVPGRPVGTAMINGKPVVNVPGPVMAAWLAADWLLKGLACHYYGISAPQREKITGTLTTEIRKSPNFEMILRVTLAHGESGWLVTPIAHAQTLPAALRDSCGLLTLPIGTGTVDAGSQVEIELLKGRELL